MHLIIIVYLLHTDFGEKIKELIYVDVCKNISDIERIVSMLFSFYYAHVLLF